MGRPVTSSMWSYIDGGGPEILKNQFRAALSETPDCTNSRFSSRVIMIFGYAVRPIYGVTVRSATVPALSLVTRHFASVRLYQISPALSVDGMVMSLSFPRCA